MSTTNESGAVADAAASTGETRKDGKFYKGRDEELRALTDKSLPHGAARLFCVLIKLSWLQPYKGVQGAVAISGRKLARMMRADVKAFYPSEQRAKVLDKEGRHQCDDSGKKLWRKTGIVTPGWIDLLIQGAYVWLTRHKIPNIPEDKALNVYHIAVYQPKGVQQSLPWMDGNWGGEVAVEETDTENGISDFAAQNEQPNTQAPETDTASHRNDQHAVGHNGISPIPKSPSGKHRFNQRAVGHNGISPIPKSPSASVRIHQRAVGENGIRPTPKTVPIEKTGDDYSDDQTPRAVNRLANRAGAATKEPAAPALTARQKESERDFLIHCEQVLGRAEMKENGGGWTVYFRTNKPKAWACLNETRSMVAEKRIKTTPAKAMMDLWTKDRLNYDGKEARR